MVDASAVEENGTWTMNGDGTYLKSTVWNGTAKVSLPASCLSTQNGMSITCKEYEAFFAAWYAFSGGGVEMTCQGSGGCSCQMTFKEAVNRQAGTYTTEGTTVVTRAQSSSKADRASYCVDGQSLTVAVPTPSGSATTTLTKR